MSSLANLKLVSAKRPVQLAPIVFRRNKLSNYIWEQLELARANAEGKNFIPTRLRTLVNKETGGKSIVEQPKRVKQAWFVAENGKVCLQLRYGTRVIDLAKGKNSIEVGSGAELIAVLETVKKAVEAGELDSQIELASNAVRERFNK
jgi:hypothetical protein